MKRNRHELISKDTKVGNWVHEHKAVVIVIILLLFFAGCTGCISLIGSEPKEDYDLPKPVDYKEPQQKEEIKVIEEPFKNTLEISRITVIKRMNEVEKILEEPLLPYGEESPLYDGTKRLLITYNDKITILELIGEPNNLEKISFIVGIPVDEPVKVVHQLGRIYYLIELLAPEISNPSEWLNEQLEKLNYGMENIEVVKGNTRIKISDYRKYLGNIILTFEPK